MRMIQLTSPGNRSVFVRADLIRGIAGSPDGGSFVFLSDGNEESYAVRETPEEVAAAYSRVTETRLPLVAKGMRLTT